MLTQVKVMSWTDRRGGFPMPIIPVEGSEKKRGEMDHRIHPVTIFGPFLSRVKWGPRVTAGVITQLIELFHPTSPTSQRWELQKISTPPPGGSPNLKYFITALQFLELIRLDKWRRVESRICLKTRWAPKSSDTWGEK